MSLSLTGRRKVMHHSPLQHQLHLLSVSQRPFSVSPTPCFCTSSSLSDSLLWTCSCVVRLNGKDRPMTAIFSFILLRSHHGYVESVHVALCGDTCTTLVVLKSDTRWARPFLTVAGYLPTRDGKYRKDQAALLLLLNGASDGSLVVLCEMNSLKKTIASQAQGRLSFRRSCWCTRAHIFLACSARLTTIEVTVGFYEVMHSPALPPFADIDSLRPQAVDSTGEISPTCKKTAEAWQRPEADRTDDPPAGSTYVCTFPFERSSNEPSARFRRALVPLSHS
ncbi:hypothetical protein IWX90DRAFT_154261 [Phyllosticta citrichinensis]|uniref:Uncharacterized protein n=1 Tax=Phyllosticta citrichinensis TaxID=1130410 RepID=A0ABR1XZX9_9PEZI